MGGVSDFFRERFSVMLGKMAHNRYVSLIVHGFYFILGIGVIFILSFIAFGFLAGNEHSGKGSVLLDASVSDVWEVVSDISETADRREDIIAVDIVETDGVGALRWNVLLDDDNSITFRRNDLVVGHHLVLEAVTSSFGLTGRWIYNVSDIGDGRTRLSLIERSSIDNWYIRSIKIFTGRNAMLRNELESISNEIKLR